MEYSDELQGFDRKRGRPVGKGRVPLSAEERRARNAQYERERRVETAEAMSDLATALGCQPNTSNAEVLARAVQLLRTMQEHLDQSDDIAELKRRNVKLMQQIDDVENRLASCENRLENQPKSQIKNGGIKKRSKSNKDKRNAKRVLRPVNESAQIDSDEHAQVAMTEVSAEALSFDAIPDCQMDWGIDHLIADYML